MTTTQNDQNIDPNPNYNLRIGRGEAYLLMGLGLLILIVGLLFTFEPVSSFYNSINSATPEKTGFDEGKLPMGLVSLSIILAISIPVIISGIFVFCKPSEVSAKKGIIAGAIVAVLVIVPLFMTLSGNSEGKDRIQRELDWAESRYGITFDSVEFMPSPRRDKAQTLVKEDGKVIARVKYLDTKIYFWDPIEDKELPLIIHP
jgi:hypothetical protein